MQVTIKVYRTAKVDTEHLKGCVGLERSDHPEVVMRALRDKFGPMAHGINIFWTEQAKLPKGMLSEVRLPEDGEQPDQNLVGVFRTTIVGIEVMGFSVTARFPQAGVASADPLNKVAIDRVDGALASELARWGLVADPDEFEWRCWYDLRGGGQIGQEPACQQEVT
jgi:hypothetical protein